MRLSRYQKASPVRILKISALLLIAALAACGGGGGDNNDTGTSNCVVGESTIGNCQLD